MTDATARQQLDPLEQLSVDYALPAVDLSAFNPQPAATALVHHTIAQRLGVLPLSRVGSTLTVVMDSHDLSAVDILRFATGLCIEVVVAPAEDITAAITRFYQLDEPQIEIEAERPVADPSYVVRTEQTANALITIAMNSPHISKHVALRTNVHRAYYVGGIDGLTDYAAAIEAAMKAHK